ncbi:unnamed protein product [Clavelina lepadiformis]|uniref:Uncharacterized protein n=1 Tax=Clavelina lepadiformis TaxID=159417 RepID=A0ABP0H629_CLALP
MRTTNDESSESESSSTTVFVKFSSELVVGVDDEVDFVLSSTDTLDVGSVRRILIVGLNAASRKITYNDFRCHFTQTGVTFKMLYVK